MIVKNEAALLGRCLAGVRSAADQIVVVDTGSTDTTREVARDCGALLIEAPWRDDFAWARNISLDAARCRWILWLDADDVVPASTLPMLDRLKRRPPDCVFGFVVKNERPGGTGTEFVQARMFPNRPELRFERRIHEQVMPSALRIGLRLEPCDAVVEHHGYADPATLKQKAARNVRLLLREYPHGAPDPVTATEIADSYQLVDDMDEAARWYRAVIGFAGCETAAPVLAAHAHYGLGNVSNRQGCYSEAIAHFEDALRLTPWRPDVLYSSAVAYELSGDAATAVELLRKIPKIKPRACQVGIDFRSAAIKAFLRVIRLLTELERYDEAGQAVLEALSAAGTRPEIQLAAGKFYLKTGALINALQAFEKSVQLYRNGNVDAYIGLCCIYRRAHREDRLIETLDAIAPLFAEDARYRTARRAFIDTNPATGSMSDAEYAERLSALQRDFFGMVAKPADGGTVEKRTR